MLCAISGEPPQEPVASKKSGQIFEKRLIEAYIGQHGNDPITGDELAVDDLVALQTARTVTPRPPTLTSIPALLSALQNEYDAHALGSFTVKQTLIQREQQLSNALYEADAASRVIARLTKERDEAREALATIIPTERRAESINGNSEHMQVDGGSLPDALLKKVDELYARLSSTRRKRAIPEDYMTTDRIRSMKTFRNDRPLFPSGSRAFDISSNGDFTLVGGLDGTVTIFSVRKQEQIVDFDVGVAVLSAACVDFEGKTSASFASAFALATGEVRIYHSEKLSHAFTAHAGPANSVALHPCKAILGSVGKDKSIVFYDLDSFAILGQVYTDSELTVCSFHPDGIILAAGGENGMVYLYNVKTQQLQATFTLSGPIQDISFSENGTWIAIVERASQEVQIWDLRKSIILTKLGFGGMIDVIQFDWSGYFLAAGGPNTTEVQCYDRGSKEWMGQPTLTRGVGITAVKWGPKAKGLAVLQTNGAMNMFK